MTSPRSRYSALFAATLLFLAPIAAHATPGSWGSVYANATLNQVVLTSGTTWTVPAGWQSSSAGPLGFANQVDVIAAGADGVKIATSIGGSGGGAWERGTNLSLTPGSTAGVAVGVHGASGGDTWFCDTTTNCASIAGTAVKTGAKGGVAASTGTGGAGGLASSGVGAAGTNGGSGGTSTNNCGGGGGGAGGLNAAGSTGAGCTVALTSGAGGAGDGGSGGAGGAAGPDGGTASQGGAGAEWTAAGSGGGGGGVSGNNAALSGAGGNYGAGGGGCSCAGGTPNAGAGSSGVIVIRYYTFQ
jgi:hypothetical protein